MNAPPPTTPAQPSAETLEAAIRQNDAMRQELAHVGNLISDLARAMHVDQAADDGSWPDLAGRVTKLTAAARLAHSTPPASDVIEARPLSEWHENIGEVVWWKFPVDEASYIGSPLGDDWPGYHTHFTPHPPVPAIRRSQPASNEGNGS